MAGADNRADGRGNLPAQPLGLSLYPCDERFGLGLDDLSPHPGVGQRGHADPLALVAVPRPRAGGSASPARSCLPVARSGMANAPFSATGLESRGDGDRYRRRLPFYAEAAAGSAANTG